jgi:hypothetical protein
MLKSFSRPADNLKISSTAEADIKEGRDSQSELTAARVIPQIQAAPPSLVCMSGRRAVADDERDVIRCGLPWFLAANHRSVSHMRL